MGLKPGYKQTAVGLIPEDWGVAPLNALISSLDAGVSVNSVAKEEDTIAHDVSILKTSCVLGGRFFPEEHKSIVPRDVHRAKLTPRKGRIVISRMNTPALVGECAYVEHDYPTLFLPDRLWMTRHEGREPFCATWLAYLLNVGAFRRAIRDCATGTSGSMKNISKGSFLSIQIPLPLKAEQQAIAEALSDADALIESLGQLIAKKSHLKQGTVQELLTGRKRLPGFTTHTDGHQETDVGLIPEDWEVVNLVDCLRERPAYGINAPAVQYQDSLPTYIRITDITDDGRFSPEHLVSVKADKAADYFLQDGDLVFARTGASVGKSYRYLPTDGRLVFAGFLIRVHPDPDCLNPLFLAAFVTTARYWNWVRLMSMRSGQPGINGNEYAQLPIPRPPIAEQAAIAAVLSDMDAEISTLEAKLAKTRQIKQGMMHNLLTGRIRLV